MCAAPSCGTQVAYIRRDSIAVGNARLAEPAAMPAHATAAGPWPAGISPTHEYQAAFDYLKEGDGHLFVTGRAGTGKSTLLTCLRELISDEMVVLVRLPFADLVENRKQRRVALPEHLLELD
jgi:hypothetical protein